MKKKYFLRNVNTVRSVQYYYYIFYSLHRNYLKQSQHMYCTNRDPGTPDIIFCIFLDLDSEPSTISEFVLYRQLCSRWTVYQFPSVGDPEQLMQIRIPLFTLTRIWISIVLIYIFKIHIFFRIKSSYPRTKSSYPIGRNHPIFQIDLYPPINDLWRIGPWG